MPPTPPMWPPALGFGGGARAASHLRCEMRAKTQVLPRFGPPEGKDLLLLDCIMEVVQWASSAARRRVAWVYDGTCPLCVP